MTFTCSASELVRVPIKAVAGAFKEYCPETTGAQVLEELGMAANNLLRDSGPAGLVDRLDRRRRPPAQVRRSPEALNNLPHQRTRFRSHGNEKQRLFFHFLAFQGVSFASARLDQQQEAPGCGG
jgi:hypothetical protein